MLGKVCLVTGANTGIGRVTAQELARAGAEVVLACRSEAKTRPVMDAIASEIPGAQLHFLPLNLGSLDSVREAAQSFLDGGRPLNVLINNAGLAGARGQPTDGFELAFGVNHLGHYLFTRLLLERLRESGPARIVNVSSKGHYRVNGLDFDAVTKRTASRTGLDEYNTSKLANVLFTQELARRLDPKEITAYALHPGVVATDVWRSVPWPFRSLIRLFMISADEGARTTLHCATAPELASESGRYYDECRPRAPNRVADDPALAADLWRRSAVWTGLDVD
jgi:retinol dehydrogenase 12